VSAKKLVLALALSLVAALFATSAFAAKAKPIYYCDKTSTPPCFASQATVNAKKSAITNLTIKGPKCLRSNGTEVDDFTPTVQKAKIKLTGKKKNKFSAKGDITLQDSARKGPYSFPYKLTGTVKHGKSISATVTVTGAVEPCANITKFSVTMKKK
jgi:hypothetical protein